MPMAKTVKLGIYPAVYNMSVEDYLEKVNVEDGIADKHWRCVVKLLDGQEFVNVLDSKFVDKESLREGSPFYKWDHNEGFEIEVDEEVASYLLGDGTMNLNDDTHKELFSNLHSIDSWFAHLADLDALYGSKE